MTRSRTTSWTSFTPRAARRSTVSISPRSCSLGPARGRRFFSRAPPRGTHFWTGREYVIPQDVKSIGYDVLRHRLLVTYEAEAEEMTAEGMLKKIFDHLPVP